MFQGANMRKALMVRRLPVALIVAFMVGLASPAVGQGESGTAEVTVTPKDCRRLIAHEPADNVAYKAGVDAYGRPVVPADLPGTQVIKAPNLITFNITYDGLKRAGVSDASGLLAGEASVGAVSYDISKGQLEFNGQSLGDPEIAALALACKSLGE
jgi:hypothetical protein